VFNANDGREGNSNSTLQVGSVATAVATGADANWQSRHGVALSAVWISVERLTRFNVRQHVAAVVVDSGATESACAMEPSHTPRPKAAANAVKMRARRCMVQLTLSIVRTPREGGFVSPGIDAANYKKSPQFECRF